MNNNFQQKIRLLSGLLDRLHTDVATSDLRINTIPYQVTNVKQILECVEVRGIGPPQTDFVDRLPHQCTPTQGIIYKTLFQLSKSKLSFRT